MTVNEFVKWGMPLWAVFSIIVSFFLALRESKNGNTKK